MIQALSVSGFELPHNDISGFERITYSIPTRNQIGLDIFHSSVIDIWIKFVRIVEAFVKFRKLLFVLIDTLLKVNLHPPERTYHHIRTDTLGERDVSHRKFDRSIFRVIGQCLAYLFFCCFDESVIGSCQKPNTNAYQ